MKNFFTFLALGAATGLSAQTIVWGVGSGDAAQDSIGRFASSDGTLAGAGWTSGAGTPAAAVWSWSNTGTTTGFLTPGWVNAGTAQYITSPSKTDGLAIFESDLLDGGTAGPGASGVAPAPHTGELLSPSIDLTGYADSVIAAHFYTAFFEFDVTALTVGLSIDGGLTWSDVDARFWVDGPMHSQGYLGRYNGWATVVFPPVLDGAANLTDCRLRFRFNGRYYFWAVDDLSLRTASAYDLSFAPKVDNYDYWSAGYVTPFQRIPSNQIDGMTYHYAVLAYNRGARTIPQSANPRVRIDVERNDAGTYTNVYTTTVAINKSIPRGDTAAVEGLLAYTPPAGAAEEYRVSYTLMHDLMDMPDNDTARHSFESTPELTVDAWYSPSGMTSAGVPRYDRTMSPAASAPNNGTDILQEYEFGNFFYFPNAIGAGNNPVAIDSVRYNVYFSPLLEPSLSELTVTILLYEWVDANGNGSLSWDELQLRTLQPDVISFSSADYGTYKTRTVPIPDPDNLNPVTNQYDLPYPVRADAVYFISMQQTNSIQGLIDLQGNRRCVFLTRRTMMYETHPGLESLSAFRYFTGPPGQAPSQQGWYTGFSRAPHDAPGMAVMARTQIPVGVLQAPASVAGSVELFPNPVQGLVTLKVDLDTQSERAQYIVTDASGRVINMEHRRQVQNDVFQFDASALPAGLYFMHLRTDTGSVSKTFVKQ